MGSDERITIGDVAKIKHGFAFKGEFFTDEPQPTLLVTPGNFSVGGGFQVGKPKFYAGPVPNDYVLSEGDLIVTMTDLSKASDTLGYAAKVPETPGVTYLHNQRVGLVQMKDEGRIRKDWLHYLMRTDHYRSWVVGSASGTTVKHTSPSRIESYSFVAPPLDLQDSAAEILDALEDRIDSLRQTNVTLEALAQAVFKSWFVDFDPVRAKAEGREPEGIDAATAALFPREFEDSELGPIPKGWRVTNVGAVAELIKGCSYKGSGLSETEGAYMFNLGCFNAKRMFATENIKRYTESYRGRQSVAEGDLIMANTDMTQQRAILGRPLFVPAGYEPAFVSHHVFKVAIRKSNMDAWRRLLFFSFQQPAFRERAVGHATGTTVLGLARDSAETCPIIEPCEETHAAFDMAIAPLLERIAKNLDQAKSLESLRDTLLPRLISGKLRLPEAESRIAEATV